MIDMNKLLAWNEFCSYRLGRLDEKYDGVCVSEEHFRYKRYFNMSRNALFRLFVSLTEHC